MIYRTEIASAENIADNAIHQRLLYAYVEAAKYVKGDLLDIGCGEGRGMHFLRDKVDSYTGIDKIQEVLDGLKNQYPNDTFLQMNIPPFKGLDSNSFDTVVSFQVIEHIEDDHGYLKEIHRVLKPGGATILSTPNIKMTLTRNPWHVREYTHQELKNLLLKYFSSVECYGVYGNEDVMKYYEENKKGVQKFTRFDIFNLQYRLPRKWLAIPYDIANKMNRKNLLESDNELVKAINLESFSLKEVDDKCFDLFYIAKK